MLRVVLRVPEVGRFDFVPLFHLQFSVDPKFLSNTEWLSLSSQFLVTSLKQRNWVAQWLSLSTSIAADAGSIPGQETKILHAALPEKLEASQMAQ